MVKSGEVRPRGRYRRYRIRSPKAFIKSSIRTHDIGRPKHTKRLAGRLRKTGRWATQAFIVPKKARPTKKLLGQIRYAKQRARRTNRRTTTRRCTVRSRRR